MSAAWPHRLRVFGGDSTAPAGGYTDDDGVWHDNPAQPDSYDLFEGLADVQDGGRMFSRDRNGDLVDKSDAVAFVKDTKKIPVLASKANLKAEITWEDDTTTMADVVMVRRLDGTIWLKRL